MASLDYVFVIIEEEEEEEEMFCDNLKGLKLFRLMISVWLCYQSQVLGITESC